METRRKKLMQFVFLLLSKSTNKELWLGKLKARFNFREEGIENRIILKRVWVK
jgi:hypothetical protein